MKKQCAMKIGCEAKEHKSTQCPEYGKIKRKPRRDGLDGLRSLLP